jgi:rod shape-determining protein MreD
MALPLLDAPFIRQVRPAIRTIPVVSIIAASLVQMLPLMASVPLLPPLGFMLFISWRLMRSDLLPAWCAAPLGLLDDLLSGQPLGSGMASWTACAILLDIYDLRVVWRGFATDWVLGGLGIAIVLIAGAVLARAGTSLDLLRLIGPQFAIALLALPLMMRLVARLDRWRIAR